MMAAAAVVIGTGWAAGSAHAQPAKTPSTFAGGCGVVAYPGTGVRGTVKVVSGPTSCGDAMEIVDRYLHDPVLVHSGNTWTAEFDGWLCVTPTAATADEYGYLSTCRDEFGGEIRVLPEQASPEPTWIPCEASVIADDIGEPVTVERCYGNWAFVTTGEVDTQSLIRLVNGTWERYVEFPAEICTWQAILDGVPAPELRSFTC
ncbi:hypothetical protein CRI77_22090 [Mycolicibacterium duvalii]|nr:hypothetical protein CRI77_22090 [Mycolicibacterium duvalii]